jgi:hypothetical protein
MKRGKENLMMSKKDKIKKEKEGKKWKKIR